MMTKSDRTFRRFKLVFGALNVTVLGLLLVVSLSASEPIPPKEGRTGTSQEIQDLRISNLEQTAVRNVARISDLEHDVTLWKGAMLGFGSLITFLEILQTFGFVRNPAVARLPRRDITRIEEDRE